MADSSTSPPTGPPPPVSPEQAERPSEPARESEQREAFEYWGYLFKPDKTGVDKLKSLLRALKDVINETWKDSDQPDLMPHQLAHFYRDLHGNYDQLFLETPSESLAFIYKSLGCLHSLQPQHNTQATAFSDPTVPALKTEGWIMWQTIQLLLGPEEHWCFLHEAVQKWDLKDRVTGDMFPKILPRQCFPAEPDKHMVAWYVGVSERLRREAEHEERQKEVEVQHEHRRRLHDNPPARRDGDGGPDENGLVDPKEAPALAYFRNPLYRHIDGRSGIVRGNFKRPVPSPRPTIVDKGKDAASTFGHIVRNVGSPHLWDGQGGSRSGSRDPTRDRRRRSHDDRTHQSADQGPSASGYDPRFPPRDGPQPQGDGRRRRPSQNDRPSGGASGDDEWDDADASPNYNLATSGSNSSRHRHHNRGPSDSRAPLDPRDQPARQTRSHEPTPSQETGDDYFAGYDDPERVRRNSAYDSKPTGSPSAPNHVVGPSFGPSASPLFASQVARQPASSHPHRFSQPPQSPPGQADPYGPHGHSPAPSNPSIRRTQQSSNDRRYSSRSPDPGLRPRSRPRRSSSRNRDPPSRPHSRFDQNPMTPYDDEDPNATSPVGGTGSHGGSSRDRDRDRNRDRDRDRDHDRDRDWDRDRDHDRDRDRDWDTNRERDRDHDYDRESNRDRDRDRRNARLSGSDVSGYHSADDNSRRSRPKVTRFADTGVSGRRYPEGGSPWRKGS